MSWRLLPAIGWASSVVAATTLGLVTVTVLSSGLTGTTSLTALSNDDVARALASATAPPSATRSRQPSPVTEQDSTRALRSPGGTIIARCQGQSVYLVSWSPAQGWEVDDYVRGPARSALVKFKQQDSEPERKVLAAVGCRHGLPEATNVEELDPPEKP